jgi:D-lactate dehydrogenase (cytochrome)
MLCTSQRHLWKRRGLSSGLADPCSFSSLPASFLDELAKLLPSHVGISTNPYDLETHGRGESYHPTAAPSAVVTPSCVADVVAIVRHCAQQIIPIIPYGAGTSVEGHVCALYGGISMDMTQFNTIEFEERANSLPNPIAKVGAGVTRKRLNEALRYEHYL